MPKILENVLSNLSESKFKSLMKVLKLYFLRGSHLRDRIFKEKIDEYQLMKY